MTPGSFDYYDDDSVESSGRDLFYTRLRMSMCGLDLGSFSSEYVLPYDTKVYGDDSSSSSSNGGASRAWNWSKSATGPSTTTTFTAGDGGGSWHQPPVGELIKHDLVPLVCAFGLIGNALTLIVLGCDRLRLAVESYGSSAGHVHKGIGLSPPTSAAAYPSTGGGGGAPRGAELHRPAMTVHQLPQHHLHHNHNHHHHHHAVVERTVNVWLKALAVSDLLFCVCLLPHAVVDANRFFYDRITFELLYTTYCQSLIHNFMLTSTWLTVTMSIARYLAVCHPLRCRLRCDHSAARRATVGVFVACAIFNAPRFIQNRIGVVRCDDLPMSSNVDGVPAAGSVADGSAPSVVYTRSSSDVSTTGIAAVYAWAHALFGIVVPLVALGYCNAKLVAALGRRGSFSDRSVGSALAGAGSTAVLFRRLPGGGSRRPSPTSPSQRHDAVSSSSSSAATERVGSRRERCSCNDGDLETTVRYRLAGCRYPGFRKGRVGGHNSLSAGAAAAASTSSRRTTTILIAVVVVYVVSVTPGEILNFVAEYVLFDLVVLFSIK